MADLCDKCWYNAYDEESDEYFCDLQLDAKMLFDDKSKPCRYFRPDIGEYGIVRKQN